MIYQKDDYSNQKRGDYTGNIFVKTGENFINNLTPKKDKLTNKHSRNNIDQKNLTKSKSPAHSSDTKKNLSLRESLEVNYDDNEKKELYAPISKVKRSKYLNTSQDFSKNNMKDSIISNITNKVLFPNEIKMDENNRYNNKESNNLINEKKIPNQYSYEEFENKDYNSEINSQLLFELKNVETNK